MQWRRGHFHRSLACNYALPLKAERGNDGRIRIQSPAGGSVCLAGGMVGAAMGLERAGITGSDFLMDGGVTAAYWLGELSPHWRRIERRRHRAKPMTDDPSTFFGRAWVALAAALALHVTDEALTDFLSVYNPAVRAIRERVPWLPLPTFSFAVWLGGLAAGVALLFALSPRAFRGARWLAIIAIPFSVMMVANGLGHLGSSIYFGRWMPGVYSSPVLIAASLAVLVCAWRLVRRPREPSASSPAAISR